MRKLLTIIALLISFGTIHAQNGLLRKSLTGYTGFSWKTAERDTIVWKADMRGSASSGKYGPYHLWANRECISPLPYNGSASVTAEKGYTSPKRWIDYRFKLQPLLAFSRTGCIPVIQEGYASARLYVFEIMAGRCYSDNYGYYVADSELTSGGLLFSHNAMPIPRVSIGTAGYVPFPFLFGYLEIKGGLTHGWLGSSDYVENTLLHHKYVGARVGGSLPVNIFYEFHHAAQWGGISPDYGPLGSTFKDYMNTFFARSGGVMANDQINAQGNHLCSQILGLDLKLGSWKASAYWQTISEDGPIDYPWNALNARDGLWGLSVTNTSFPYISGILYEYLHTSNQAGAFHDRDGVVYGGSDSYFTNSIYQNGWTYMGYTIGHPLIISTAAIEGSISPVSNRMRAHHAGIKGNIKGYRYRALATYTRLYDNYERPTDTYNHAFMLEVSKNFPKLWGLDFRISLAMDTGNQFGKSHGIMFSVAKTGLIWGQK